MKTLFITIVAIVVQTQCIWSQVGVNTFAVSSGISLYIEGGNTGVTTDDVIIDNNGKVGIGMIPTSATLSIKGNINYPFAIPSKNRVLLSDADGFGSWTYLALGNKTAYWTLSNSTFSFPSSTVTQLTGTSTVQANDEIGLQALANSVKVPAGRYLVMLNGDIGNREYGRISVYNGATTVISVIYGETLNTAIRFVEFATPATLTLTFAAYNPAVKTTSATDFYLVPPFVSSFNYGIRLLKLN